MDEVIMNCVTTTSINMLWHGAPTEVFQPTGGIRQGDPLSPYLFVLCMERFGNIIADALREGVWRPIFASRGGPPLSHLFFADDLILFGETTLEQTKIMKHCLDRFCTASG